MEKARKAGFLALLRREKETEREEERKRQRGI